jgi:hypothetical protein
LNGAPLAAGSDGTLPPLEPVVGRGRRVALPATSYAFVLFPEAAQAACR